MMSSATSTDTTFRPWHLFVLAGLVAATVGVVIVRPRDPAAVVLLVAAIGAAGGVGFAFYRMIWPLATRELQDRTEMVGGRTRAALEREKTLALRSIKELEFDRAMGKVSHADFQEMGGRLRARALNLMQQLDVDGTGYREIIARDLAELLGRPATPAPPSQAPAERRGATRLLCDGCGTSNERDARFCKKCGNALD